MTSGLTIGIGAGGPVSLSRDSFVLSWAVSGMTGSGKTGFLMGLIRTALLAGIGVTFLDPKGEGSSDLLMFVAAMGDIPARKLRVLAPFRADKGVRFGLLAPQPGLSREVQASLLVDLVGRLISGFGPRMSRLTYRVLLAGLHAGVGLPDVLQALRDDAHRLALAERLSDPETRSYLVDQLPRERASADAVLARLEWVCRIPSISHAISSLETLPDEHVLPPGGLTVVNLGGAPQGSAAIADFFGQLFMMRASAAVFSRAQGRRAERPHPHLIVADEVQRVMRDSADETERLLCEARSFRCGLVMATQSFNNRAFDDRFRAVLSTNVAHQFHLRPSEEELRSLKTLVPVSGRMRDPQRCDRVLPEREEQEALLHVLRSLPSQEGLFCTRGQPPRLMRSLAQPFARAAETFRRLPATVQDAYRDGILAVPTAVLEAEAGLRIRPTRPSAGPRVPSDPGGGGSEDGEEEIDAPIRRTGKRPLKLVLR